MADFVTGQRQQGVGHRLFVEVANDFAASSVGKHQFTLGTDSKFTHTCRCQVRVEPFDPQFRVGPQVALEQGIDTINQRTARPDERGHLDRTAELGQCTQARLGQGMGTVRGPIEAQGVTLSQPTRQPGQHQHQGDKQRILQPVNESRCGAPLGSAFYPTTHTRRPPSSRRTLNARQTAVSSR